MIMDEKWEEMWSGTQRKWLIVSKDNREVTITVRAKTNFEAALITEHIVLLHNQALKEGKRGVEV